MLYLFIPLLACFAFLAIWAIRRGWTTLPSMGGFALTAPAWVQTWWGANWALIVIFLPLLVVTVLLLLPALPIGYAAYAAHGGATGWLLIFLVLFLAIAFTIPQKWLRTPATIALVVLLFWVVFPAILWTVLGYCTSTDTACLNQQAAKEEQKRQSQAAAQRAIESSRQPNARQCNVQRRPHRYPATKPAAYDNPGGECALALFIKGHCVYFTQNNNDRTAGMICVNDDNQVAVRDMRNAPINMPEDVDRVWSAGAAFDGSIGLWQPRYTKLLSWR